MILVALGSNISGPWGNPKETLLKAFEHLDHAPLKLIKSSSLLETAPFGVLDQPNFCNAVAQIETELNPLALLHHLKALEKLAGRLPTKRWGPRTLDLDILDYDGLVQDQSDILTLPHPGIHERTFVLGPIAEIAPNWRHPTKNTTAQELLSLLID